MSLHLSILICFLNAPPTAEIYTLSLHDALPISFPGSLTISASSSSGRVSRRQRNFSGPQIWPEKWSRSEEHTSELQSLTNLVCRLLLEKKKKNIMKYRIIQYSIIYYGLLHYRPT